MYRDLIQPEYDLTTNVDDADIVVLHREPYDFGALYSKVPSLAHKYVIGCCVWEASELPDAYKRSISLVQEIWTCSKYCVDIFQPYNSKVVCMPYAVERDKTCSDQDRSFVRAATGHEPGCVYFLAVTKLDDKRKNVNALIHIFRHCKRAMPKARLIIKAVGGDVLLKGRDPQIIYLCEEMSNSQINALYEMADVYVSVHHSEAWGLTISDAMIFRKPVLATGYSGNLEFMTPENSFLLDFTESYIRPRDCFGLFHTGMKWAYPRLEDIAEKLLILYEHYRSRLVMEKVARASTDIARLSGTFVKQLLLQRLNDVASSQI
jgi:glycosyltransferase involved in cell wall biosynthesis